MEFIKMHGAGNDFVLVKTDDAERDWASLAVSMCDRHFGIGSDGLLLVMPSTKADCRMRMFDPDGSEAEACGNGIRCVGRFIYDQGMVKPEVNTVTVETLAGIRKLELFKEAGKLTGLQAGMGKPRFAADEIPVTISGDRENTVYIKNMLRYSVTVAGMNLPLNLVSMGNPHAVYFLEQPVADFPLSEIGPKVEHLDIFPKRANFEIARVISRNEIEVRVWERGVGETLACGSGACAVAVAAQLYDYADRSLDIRLPGGTLQLEWDGVGEVLCRGPAENVFEGEWPE
ncbi:MAG: diaminopimelate epimerase [Chloroflexi bacterium]|nr:diaminopimelate epimerase [Chloroflexota bacterium]